jgi:hypothetical protein
MIIQLDEDHCPVWTTHMKNGKPYRGIGVKPDQVLKHKEAWQKKAY